MEQKTKVIIQGKDRIECAIRHIESSLDVDPWAVEIAVDAMEKEISALQAQDSPKPTAESVQNVQNEDLILRKAAIDVLGVFTQADALGHTPKQIVEALPSAQPERKTGWWFIREGISDAQCSECKMYFRDVYDMDNSDAFCRQCGTKMEGLKVVEDE